MASGGTTKKVEEANISHATGVKARFMTYVQRITAVILSAKVLCDNITSNSFNNFAVGNCLAEIACYGRPDVRFNHSPERVKLGSELFSLIENEQKQFKDYMKRQHKREEKEYDFLLWCLRRLEESFNEFTRDSSAEKSQLPLAITNILKIIKKLLQQMSEYTNKHNEAYKSKKSGKNEQSSQTASTNYFIQRSLVVRRTINFCRNKWKILVDSSDIVQQEQILTDLIPRLKVMVVSEIIASFNLSMLSHFITVNNNVFHQDRSEKSFCALAERTLCQRDWDCHNLEEHEAMEAFHQDALSIVRFLDTWLVDPTTRDFQKLPLAQKNIHPSFVFPGLWEYHKTFTTNLLYSDEILRLRTLSAEERNELQLTKKDLAKKSKELEQTTDELISMRQELADSKKEKEQLEDNYRIEIAQLTSQLRSREAPLPQASLPQPPAGIPQVVEEMQD